MKTITILFSLIFLAPATHAQNYMISFAGTGAATTVDSVHVQNLTQCTDIVVMGSDVLNLSSTVGINTFSNEGSASINIFPNPSAGSCIANFEATVNGNTTISIYDALGKSIAQTQQYLTKGKHSFDITGLSSGAYLLKIQSDKYSCTAKLLSNNNTEGNLSITEIPATSQLPTGKIKGAKNTIGMLFYAGDTLKLTGYFGIYKTVMVLMPTQSQTITFNFIPCTDADGNNYAVVQIGTQVWMEENLKTTKYSNGNSIPYIPDNTQWSNLTTGAYSYYNNDLNLGKIYGAFYNWYVVSDTRNACPNGWHVPSNDEWKILVVLLGDTTIAGGKLKDVCSNLWNPYNNNTASNESGFTALPTGARWYDGTYNNLTGGTGWWTGDLFDNQNALYWQVDAFAKHTFNMFCGFLNGVQIRCIKN